MRSIEVKAKNMEEAVSQGLKELGVAFSDVKIEVIEEGSKGFLGLFGAKPVVVRLTVNSDAVEHDVLKSVGLKESKKGEVKTNKNTQPRPATKPAGKPQAKPAAKPVANNEQGKGDAKPATRRQPNKQAVKPVKEQRANTQRPARQQSRPTVATQEGVDKAVAFLKELTSKMGVTVTIEGRIDDEGSIRVDMHGDTLGILIGRRGETLDALQYLTSLVVNRGQENYSRITLDTENYRAKREEALVRLANRMASRAVKTGRKVVMEPMNPYERRILHSALQKNEAVVTHSEGDEPNRHVVITVK